MIHSLSPYVYSPLAFAEQTGLTLAQAERVVQIYQNLWPLTAPFQDRRGYTVQVFKLDNQLIASVISPDKQLMLIREDQIVNPLNHKETPEALSRHLATSTFKNWRLVLDVEQMRLTIWPIIVAAGIYEKMAFQEVLSDVQKRLNTITEKGALNARHYQAYQKESRGVHIKGRDGKVLINPRTKRPYDHIQDVRLYQKAARNLIEDIREEIYPTKFGRFSKYSQAERKKLEDLFVRTSKILDDSRKFTSSNHRAHRRAQVDFAQVVQQTRLTRSYNAVHGQNAIPSKGNLQGEIGGVACQLAYIKGLFDNEEEFFEGEHLFCLPALQPDHLPCSSQELRELLRELAMGVFQGALPYVSLHIKQGSGDLFTVLHPFYQQTLVGRVIGLLDYYMKGYIRGGAYFENFLNAWHQNPSWKAKSASALEQLLCFEEYCKNNLDETPSAYLCLEDMLERLRIAEFLKNPSKTLALALLGIVESDAAKTLQDDQEAFFEEYTGFVNSFRIIAKQKSYQKAGNAFYLDPDFEVLYTIEPPLEYRVRLKAYEIEHGCRPKAYERLVSCFEMITQKIHDHMVKLPFCQSYFAMLGIISFFSSYFATLKSYAKVPILPMLTKNKAYSCPPLFPSIPVALSRVENLKLSFGVVVQRFFGQNCDTVKPYLKKALQHIRLIEDVEEKKTALKAFEVKTYQELQLQMIKACQQYCLQKQHITSKRFLEQDKDVNRVLSSVSAQLMEKLLEVFGDYVDLLMQKLKSQGISWEKVDINAVLENFLNLAPQSFTQEEQTLEHLRYRLTYISSELSKIEKQRIDSLIRGGCSVELLKQAPLSSLKAEQTLFKGGAKLDSVEAETWKKIKFDDGSIGFVFRLPFEDLSPELGGDYSWMSSTLLAPQGMQPKDIDAFLELQDAMEEDSEHAFKQGLEELERKDLKDLEGQTFVHIAAQAKNPFYLKTLLGQGFDPHVTDIHGYLPLHVAAAEGNLETLKLLLSSSTLNAKTRQGATPLFVAVQRGQIEIVRYLLKWPVQTASYLTGYTELHSALHQENEELFALLFNSSLDKACLSCSVDGQGTPLMMAAERGLTGAVKLLLQAGACPFERKDRGANAFVVAIENGQKAVLELFMPICAKQPLESCTLELIFRCGDVAILKGISNIQRKAFANYCNLTQHTALHVALYAANFDVAEWLIDYVEDVNAKDINKRTAFELAVAFRAWKVAEKLLRKGAQVNLDLLARLEYHPFFKTLFDRMQLSDEQKLRCLLLAAEAGNTGLLLHVLKPKGLALEALQGPRGWRLVHYLARAEDRSLFNQLILKTKDVLQPIQEEGGKTLAYIAAEWGNAATFRSLMRALKKQELSLEGHFHDQHLFAAVLFCRRFDLIEEMLIEFADLDLLNKTLNQEGQTALHLACKRGALEVAQLLIKKGADLTARDRSGRSAFELALQSGSLPLIQYLQDKGLSADFAAFNSQAIDTLPDRDVLDFHDLLRQGIWKEPAAKAQLLGKDADDQTALHVAAQGQANVEVLQSLIDQLPVDYLHACDKFGKNAIHHALKGEGSHQMAKIALLVEAGVDVNQHDFAQITPLLLACQKQSPVLVRALLQMGANPHLAGTVQHLLPLHLAVMLPSPEVFIELLAYGANPYQIDCQGLNVAHRLAFEGKEELLRFFIADERAMRSSFAGFKPLHLAALQGHLEIVRSQLAAGASIDEGVRATLDTSLLKDKEVRMQGATPLFLAALGGHVEVIRCLLEAKSDFNITNLKGENVFNAAALSPAPRATLQALLLAVNTYPQEMRLSVLMQAAECAICCDQVEAVQELYRCGLMVDAVLKNGYTGLQLASYFGALKTARWLLQEGADPYIRTREEETAFALAAKGKSANLLGLLLDTFAIDPNALFSKAGQTLLHIAAQAGNLAHIAALLMRGANVKMQDHLGYTALHCAIEAKRVRAAKLLLIAGSSLQTMTYIGQRALELAMANPLEEGSWDLELKSFYNSLLPPLHLAVESEDMFFIRLFCQIAEVNAVDAQGQTALHLAVKKGYRAATLALLRARSNVNVQDRQGRSALWYACLERQDPQLVAMLMQKKANPHLKDRSGSSILTQVAAASFNGKEQIIKRLKKAKHL